MTRTANLNFFTEKIVCNSKPQLLHRNNCLQQQTSTSSLKQLYAANHLVYFVFEAGVVALFVHFSKKEDLPSIVLMVLLAAPFLIPWFRYQHLPSLMVLLAAPFLILWFRYQHLPSLMVLLAAPFLILWFRYQHLPSLMVLLAAPFLIRAQ